MGYEAVWRSSSSKLHLTRAKTQFLHDGNILSHLFFLLWHREHEARALAGAENCAADAAGPMPLLRAIGEEQSRKNVTRVGIAGISEFGVLGYLPFYRASPIAPAFCSGLSPIHLGAFHRSSHSKGPRWLTAI
ncbi:hypothetical protein N7449_009246 [Penicillium cf. viridicatum]|uniref:Uncharacterized protein n=1 Tax=Penicillium cf. viridicatum TaxID=2972119 RepID=A0A9W9M8W4_9EURO|nr:hypothetical protein N7449_009246 [Penicillium cf. viridicatum]